MTPRHLLSVSWFPVLVVVMVILTAKLGFWQLERAEQKEQLVLQQQKMTNAPYGPPVAPLNNFQPVLIEGRTQSVLWWDNRTHNGVAGYELLVAVELNSFSFIQLFNPFFNFFLLS